MDENACIDWLYLRGRGGLALRLEVLKVAVDLRKRRSVETSLEAAAFENNLDRLDWRLRRERRKRRNSAIEAPCARLGRGEIHRRRHAARHVRVDLDRHLRHRLAKRGDEFARGTGRKDAGHVLDRERVDAHRFLLLRELDVLRDGVDGRRRVAERALRVAAVLLHACDCDFEVARIVERVKDAEDVHSVLTGKRDKTVDDVVWIVLVAEDILATEEHLERRLLADLLDAAKALPRILAQEAHADVERRAAPALERVISRVVDRLGNLEDVVGAHARRPKRLVRVAERRVRDPDERLLHVCCHFHFPF